MASKQSSDLSKKEYEQIGRTFVSVVESGYASRWRVYRINLVRGLFFGVGSALGATILLALTLWFLSFFTELPIIGELAETIRSTIDSNTNSEF